MKTVEQLITMQDTYLKELRETYSVFEKVGSGADKVVYRAKKGEKEFAIKVMFYKKEVKSMISINEKLNKKILENKDHKHFFVLSRFFESKLKNSKKLPLFIYEVSPYYDFTLSKYFRKKDWEKEDFVSIFCQVIHGLTILNKLNILFTDLKLLNIMIRVNDFRVSLNDFYDSLYDCTYKGCNEEMGYMFTYMDKVHPKTLHEQSWLLGLLMINVLEKKYKQIKLPEANYINFSVYIRNEINKKKKYPPAAFFQKYFDNLRKELLGYHDVIDVIQGLLNPDMQQRLKVEDVLKKSPFSEKCFTSQGSVKVNYRSKTAKSKKSSTKTKKNVN
jgi:serine/threonine protein kinase